MHNCSPLHRLSSPWPCVQVRRLNCGVRAGPLLRPRRLLAGASDKALPPSLDFTKVTTEEQFLGALEAAYDLEVLPRPVVDVWIDFYQNYKNAVLNSGVEGANLPLVLEVQASIADRVVTEMMDPFTFQSYHERILEPYNYFEFGQKYVGTLINFQDSVLGHLERWDEIERQLEERHNVVLLANHQTEADPAVFAHMLAATHPTLGENVIYVAGDRVVTDAMCKPFSMGRNLFCVHSKKHMDDIPELKQEKMAMNRRTLAVMARKMNEGGLLIWIAPSGGRDRPDDNGLWRPAPFDPTAVELFRKLVTASKQDGHLYPMAMLSWGVMPPPKKTLKTLGERRLTTFSGVGLSVCEELDVESLVGGVEDPVEAQQTLSGAAQRATEEEYKRIEQAINDPSARASMPEFKQPWLRAPVPV